MASTTANRSQIEDFIWEWAESHGDWSKLLVINIVGSKCNLQISERQLVFNFFLQLCQMVKDILIERGEKLSISFY